MRRSGSQRANDTESVVDDVARFDGGIRAQATGAIELRDGVGPGAPRDELLLVNESHRAQVLALDSAPRVSARSGNVVCTSAWKYRDRPRVGRTSDVERARRQMVEPRLDVRTTLRNRGWPLEAVDQRLRTQRRFDGGRLGEVAPLQRVEDQMIEVPFADPCACARHAFSRRTRERSRGDAAAPRAWCAAAQDRPR